jgi:single-stranded DNA-binding protein
MHMQVFGNVATQPERKQSKTSGKGYFEFRMAEAQRGIDTAPTWFSVRVMRDENPMLDKGDFVRVTGKLRVDHYLSREGKPSGTLLILAFEASKIAKPTPVQDGEKSGAPVAPKETGTQRVQATHAARTQELAPEKPQVQAQERQDEAVAMQQQESDWSSLYS